MRTILFTCMSLILVPPLLTAQLRVMGYNIRYDNPSDGPDRWEERRADLLELLLYYHPEVIGMQEVLAGQLAYLDKGLTNYARVGVGRADGKDKGEFSPIFYDTLRFRLLETRTRWLSETPDRPSVGWDAALERIVTYAALVDRTSGDTLHVFNTHFDHRGQMARKNSAAMILEWIRELVPKNGRLVLTGDLNCSPEDPPMEILKDKLQDAFLISRIPPYGPKGTFNGFDPTRVPQTRIDHILTRKLLVQDYRIIDDRRPNGRWPSDHLPIMGTMELW